MLITAFSAIRPFYPAGLTTSKDFFIMNFSSKSFAHLWKPVFLLLKMRSQNALDPDASHWFFDSVMLHYSGVFFAIMVKNESILFRTIKEWGVQDTLIGVSVCL